MADNVSFKVYLKDPSQGELDTEVRRFVVDKEVSTSLIYIKEKLVSVFPVLAEKLFSVSWTDEDGDAITIDTDEELILALTELAGPVYKLTATVRGAKRFEQPPQQEPAGVGANVTHHGVTCDGCDKAPIVGFRYKCVVCDDYDLCGSCEKAGKHPGHNMMRISSPEVIWPQRLFKRIHKMQEKAEQRSRCRQEKQERKEEREEPTGNAPPPPPFFGRGRGMFRGCGRGGMGGMGGMGMGGPGMGGAGMGGMGNMGGGMGAGRGGMGGRGGQWQWQWPGGAASAWAGPTFEAMMQGWMGEQPGAAPGNAGGGGHQNAHAEAQASAANAHASAHSAAQAAAEDAHTAAHAAAQAAQAAEEAFAAAGMPEGSGEDYLQRVGDFVAAALDPLGIDVQVDVETSGGQRTTVKPTVKPSEADERKEDKAAAETEEAAKEMSASPTKERSTSLSDDEEWTVLADKKPDSDAVEIPIQVLDKQVAPVYPTLPPTEGTTTSTTLTETATTQDQGAAASAPPATVAVHPDPRIQVALQAMMNMGFSNEGGWLANLLEAKNGDIGKVLDILQPVKK